MVITQDQALGEKVSLSSLVKKAKAKGWIVDTSYHHPAVGKVFIMKKQSK